MFGIIRHVAVREHAPSYYAATANLPSDFPQLGQHVDADVCVVGGGFTGLSTALELAERGYHVVVLEAEQIGWGASGRSGGQIVSGFAADMSKIRKWAGEEGAYRLFQACEEAKTIIQERVARYSIDCDLTWGHFDAANKAAHMDELRAMRDDWQTHYNYHQFQIVDRKNVADYVQTPAYVGGLYDSGGGHLHPLNYCLGLAHAARASGVQIYQESRVTNLEMGARPCVQTERGRVCANTVVFAVNGYLGNLVPRMRQHIMPVGTYIGATAPLGEHRAQDLMPANAGVTDCAFVLDYFRRSADHRLLFGGRVSYSTVMPPNLPRAMRRKMLTVFPQLSDQHLEYAWGGYVAITMERTPHLGQLGPNVYFAQGFSGHGVALTGVAGRIMAEAIAAQTERFDVFAKLPHTAFPGGRIFRMPILALAMMWYRIRDVLG